MIGIDIVRTERISQLDIDAFAKKIGCDAEWLAQKKDKAQSLAAVFAVKEAVVKALGCGFCKDVTLKDVEVCHKDSGEPFVILHGKANEILKSKGNEIFVSASHDGEYAVAVAIVK